MRRIRLLRITTVPISLATLLKGQPEYFMQHDFDVLTVSADGPEVNALKGRGINHVVIPLTRKITPLTDLVALFKLIFLIRKFKPDIVHSHTPKAGLIGMMAAWLCGVRGRLHTVAGLPLMEARGVKRTLLKTTERITYACANRVYPNSMGLLTFIRNEFYSSIKFKVLSGGSSNGIDAAYYSSTSVGQDKIEIIRKQYSIGSHEFVLCFIGRLVKDKGIRELVDAFESLAIDNSRLLLVGPREQELDPLPTETIRKIESNPKIFEVGFQQDVRHWLALSHVLVFPSYREGFPNVVLQAACLELPCIVTDINGCNEIIQHHKTGIIVPPKDPDALRDAIQNIYQMPDRGKSLGKLARVFVASHFDQRVIWDALLKEYLSFVK